MNYDNTYRGTIRRGRGRGEGHFTYRPSIAQWDVPKSDPANMRIGLSTFLVAVDHTKLFNGTDDDIAFTDVRDAGGYRWMSKDKPVISVPGVPDVWNDSARVAEIISDDKIPGLKECRDFLGTILLPHNISPLEPIFHSLASPSVLDDVSLICNRNSLRKLYRLCTPLKTSDKAQEWRIDAELVGNTVLLTRWEDESLRCFVRPKGVSAQSYHLAATRSTTPGGESGGCDRLVTYNFAGMKLLVRFDIDACLVQPDRTSGGGEEDKGEVDSKTGGRPTAIRVICSGYEQPLHSTLVEIKTRNIHRPLDMVETYDQLVFSQTPWLYVARHDWHDYSVCATQKYQLDGPEMMAVGKSREGVMRDVAGTLKEMVRITQKYGEVSFVVVNGEMKAYKRTGGVPVLSEMSRGMILGAA